MPASCWEEADDNYVIIITIINRLYSLSKGGKEINTKEKEKQGKGKRRVWIKGASMQFKKID